MAIQGVTYNNQRVAAADHAALFQMFITDGIMSGCGASTLRNTLTISSGLFIIAGRLTKIIGSETITIPNTVVSTTKKLIGVCDMGQVAQRNSFGQFYFKLEDSNYELKKEDINTGNGQYYEVEWATLTIDASSNITECNVTIPAAGGGGGSGGNNHLTTDDFEYLTGQYLFDSSSDDWELAFLSSGTFKLNKNLNGIDIFVVGAGFDGNTNIEGTHTTDHDGGDGGYYRTWDSDSLAAGTYEVVIGAGSGAMSSIGERAVSSSDSVSVHKQGGIGAKQPDDASDMNDAEDGANGVYAFGSSTSLISSLSGRQYGASGGGGAWRGYNTSAQHATDGARGVGGITGAGSGGVLSAGALNGGDAAANTGAGGGGRAGNLYGQPNGTPGHGGSGIIIIRNHRSAA